VKQPARRDDVFGSLPYFGGGTQGNGEMGCWGAVVFFAVVIVVFGVFFGVIAWIFMTQL